MRRILFSGDAGEKRSKIGEHVAGARDRAPDARVGER
jgi:hypothetical protein